MFSFTFFCFRLSAILDIPPSEIIISGLFKHRDYKDLIKRKRKPWGKKKNFAPGKREEQKAAGEKEGKQFSN